jgi:serine protease Do
MKIRHLTAISLLSLSFWSCTEKEMAKGPQQSETPDIHSKVAKYFETSPAKVPSTEDMLEQAQKTVVVIEAGDKLGSGVVVRSDGYVVTNRHVVDDEALVKVRLYVKPSDAKTAVTFDGVTVYRDPLLDLAVVKVLNETMAYDRKTGQLRPGHYYLPVMNFGDSSSLRTGSDVYAIGAPLGFEQSVTQGIVSAPLRSYPVLYRGKPIKDKFYNYIQTDTPIHSGNSGGPLVTKSGTLALQTATMGFSIPSNDVRKVVDKAFESFEKHPLLGIHLGTGYTKTTGYKFSNDPNDEIIDQVVISKFEPDSNGEKIGLQVNDVILEFDGISPYRDTEMPSRRFVNLVRASDLSKVHVIKLFRPSTKSTKKIRFRW